MRGSVKLARSTTKLLSSADHELKAIGMAIVIRISSAWRDCQGRVCIGAA
jgi:hypothetical protein